MDAYLWDITDRCFKDSGTSSAADEADLIDSSDIREKGDPGRLFGSPFIEIRCKRVEYQITLACGCWKVTLELLMSDEYLNKWAGETGNLWLLPGWLCRTAEKQM